jgi:hypothetical protein
MNNKIWFLVSDIPPKRPSFTKEYYKTATVTGGKPIAVWLQSIPGEDAVNPLVVF